VTLSVLANIDVDDLARASDFYCSALGLRIGRRFGNSAVELLGASTAIYLLEKGSGTLPSPDSPGRRIGRQFTSILLSRTSRRRLLKRATLARGSKAKYARIAGAALLLWLIRSGTGSA
jgi:catechol 2,3-dioxygenase-like lactoylglutathione lyase family enzyme